MPHTDVIIAGAGPAGSTAACVLARRGFSVLVVDRAAFPRPKLCGGLVTWKSVRLLEHLYGLRPADLIDAGVVDTVTDGFALHYRDRCLAQGRFAYPFHLLDRTAFDASLLNRARAAGVEVREGCAVRGCDPDGAVDTDQGRLRGRFVIGADGVNSVLRQCCGVDRQRWSKGAAPAIEISAPWADVPRRTDRPELFSGILPAGYGWFFPNRDRAVLGICGLPGHTRNFRQAFLDFLTVLGVDDPEDLVRRHPLRGHPLPYGNALARPWSGNTLLVGDAAGLADPLLGEGIFYALLSGWYAAEAIAQALRGGPHPGPAYTERLTRFVGPEMRGANRLRWLLFGLEKCASPAALGGYFRLRTGALAEMVHGIRSYAWGRKKTWDF